MSYCLAIDIGASSGRHILGELKNGRLETKEIYRFENGFKEQDGTLIWDIEQLTSDVVAGIAECKKLGLVPETVAIDTWGVDYVLFDGEGTTYSKLFGSAILFFRKPVKCPISGIRSFHFLIFRRS